MPASLELSGDCGIRNVAELAAAFQAGPDRGDVTVDATGLTSVDVSILQLLISARQSASASGRGMKIIADEAGALGSAVERAGLSPVFEDMLKPATG